MDFFAPIFKQNLKKRKHDAESGRELDALQGMFIFRQEKDHSFINNYETSKFI